MACSECAHWKEAAADALGRLIWLRNLMRDDHVRKFLDQTKTWDPLIERLRESQKEPVEA